MNFGMNRHRDDRKRGWVPSVCVKDMSTDGRERVGEEGLEEDKYPG